MTAQQEIVFRIRKLYWNLGLFHTILFLVMGIAFAALAAWNPDGSFKYPIPTGIGVFVLYSAIALTGVWMMVEYKKTQLELSADSLRCRGVFKSHLIPFDTITKVEWSLGGRGNAIILHPQGRYNLDFARYSNEDKAEISNRLHDALSSNIQSGWDTFDSTYILPNPERLKAQRKSGVFAIVLFFVIGVAFVALGALGDGARNYIAAVLNFLFALWLLYRMMKRRHSLANSL